MVRGGFPKFNSDQIWKIGTWLNSILIGRFPTNCSKSSFRHWGEIRFLSLFWISLWNFGIGKRWVQDFFGFLYDFFLDFSVSVWHWGGVRFGRDKCKTFLDFLVILFGISRFHFGIGEGWDWGGMSARLRDDDPGPRSWVDLAPPDQICWLAELFIPRPQVSFFSSHPLLGIITTPFGLVQTLKPSWT